MELREIIDEIASQADDFLVNTSDHREAKAAITEIITTDYPELSDKSRRVVLHEVMHILEAEDFFGIAATAESWRDESDDDV